MRSLAKGWPPNVNVLAHARSRHIPVPTDIQMRSILLTASVALGHIRLGNHNANPGNTNKIRIRIVSQTKKGNAAAATW